MAIGRASTGDPLLLGLGSRLLQTEKMSLKLKPLEPTGPISQEICGSLATRPPTGVGNAVWFSGDEKACSEDVLGSSRKLIGVRLHFQRASRCRD
jgi:hypothetical protein